MTWWRESVVYQIYVRSFADSDGDGVGDLRGVLSRLDHLEWLGVDAVWLSPVHPSPNHDWGYDVADYLAVDPELGTLDDLDRLIAEAGRRGIRVLLDLVPNHTSDRHPWFLDARSSRGSSHRDWYVWHDPKADGSPPNNWLSSFGGPAWTFDEASGQYYLHNFLPSQPDLNWWNPDVRASFEGILRFWFDRGVAGFRIDVCHMMVKDRELRDNPTATEDDHPFVRLLGQRQLYNSCRAESHEILRGWRRIADSYDPPRLLLGETYVFDLDRLAGFYGAGDELHLAFNIPFIYADFDSRALAAIVSEIERRIGRVDWPVWTASNHDVSRFPTRWCGDDRTKVRLALLLLLTLRGTPVLYYGDEIGMTDTDVPYDELRDPVGKKFWPASAGRDRCRTPIAWEAVPGAGFTRPGRRPWLRFGNLETNVLDESRDPRSVLSFCRDLIALRRSAPELRAGTYTELPSPAGVWMFRRGGLVVALNFSDASVDVPGHGGRIRIGTQPNRQGEVVTGPLRLGPWEGVVIGDAPG
ncbi:MAG: alpha-amylase family glycosyl hydrolase [Candidatus Binatia bacterium]